jgi:hypothetical protein
MNDDDVMMNDDVMMMNDDDEWWCNDDDITIIFSNRYFSNRPHVGGTSRSKELADEIEKRWREYKFDKVEQPKYNILLPYIDPDVSNSVQILNSSGDVTYEFSGKQKVF